MFGFGKRTWEGSSAAERRFDFICDCAKAAANLYGVISLRDFADKVVAPWHAECRDDALSPETMRRMDERARRESAPFVVRQDELLHVSLQDDESLQSSLRKLHLGRSPWMPEKEGDFLAYGKDEDLCVPTAKAFRALFPKQSGPMADVSMAQPLIDQCRRGCGDDGDLDVAAGFLPMTTGADEEKVCRLLSDLRNKTRVWALFGQTAEELGMQRTVHPKDVSGGSRQLPSLTPSSLAKSGIDLSTVGRNDPCPCGSGKKFKKCCGR